MYAITFFDQSEYQRRFVYADRDENIVLSFPNKKAAQAYLDECGGRYHAEIIPVRESPFVRFAECPERYTK